MALPIPIVVDNFAGGCTNIQYCMFTRSCVVGSIPVMPALEKVEMRYWTEVGKTEDNKSVNYIHGNLVSD
jgi:hypothetical protein